MPGIVANVDELQVGAVSRRPAQPAFSLVATDDLWVEANPKETDLTYREARRRRRASRSMPIPAACGKAKVASISPATGAEFSVLPAQNASGNWVKVVQRVPVRLRVERAGRTRRRCASGMSVEVAIDTGHSALAASSSARPSPQLGL